MFIKICLRSAEPQQTTAHKIKQKETETTQPAYAASQGTIFDEPVFEEWQTA